MFILLIKKRQIMKNILKTTILATAIISQNANASDFYLTTQVQRMNFETKSVAADNEIYPIISGYNDTSSTFYDASSNYDADEVYFNQENDIGFKIGYKILKNISVEVGFDAFKQKSKKSFNTELQYIDANNDGINDVETGQEINTLVKYNKSGVDLIYNYELPTSISEKTNYLLKLGYSKIDLQTNFTNTLTNPNGSINSVYSGGINDSGYGINFGAGLQKDIGSNAAIRIMFDYTKINNMEMIKNSSVIGNIGLIIKL